MHELQMNHESCNNFIVSLQAPPSKKPNTGSGPTAAEQVSYYDRLHTCMMSHDYHMIFQSNKPKLKASDVKALYKRTYVLLKLL